MLFQMFVETRSPMSRLSHVSYLIRLGEKFAFMLCALLITLAGSVMIGNNWPICGAAFCLAALLIVIRVFAFDPEG